MPSPLIEAYHKDLSDKNAIRYKEQKKQYIYYIGDGFNIKKYLTDALEMTYASIEVVKMQLQWVNITEKIINQMSVVYLEPAVRTIMINGKENEEWTEYYLDIIPKNINTADKEGHRMAKLQNTALPHITFDKEQKRFQYRTQSSHFYDIKHDYGKLTEISYEKYFVENGEDAWYKVYWTDEEHYRRDIFGNEKQPVPESTNGIKNPFGVIPFPTFRLKNSIYFWGEGQCDIINVNEQVNLLLTKLINRDIILGEGILFGVNLNLHKKGKEKEGEKVIRASVSHPITADEVRADMVTPTLQYVGTNPQIDEVKETIDWYIKMIANFNGLNPNAVLSQIKDTSDFQKIMDAVDQMEVRKDDIEPCRAFEEERFEITKIMNNTLIGTPAAEGLKTIPEDATLFVDFADIEVQKTPQDLRDDYDWRLKNNLTTLIEILKEENPDLTTEQAEEILATNKTANSALGGTASSFELLTRKPVEPEE